MELEELYIYIAKRMDLSTKAKQYIRSVSRVITLKKDTFLSQEGQKVNKTYFVIDGCLRSFYLDKNGKEHTLQFAVKDWWISDFMAIVYKESSSLNIKSITDSTIIEFNLSDIDRIYTIFPEFEAFQRKNLENHVASLHKRLLNQLQLSAEERYSNFLEQYPEIEKSALNYHIASYLGITQQSLSRIRSNKNI